MTIALSRRALLRGVGAAVALPFLDAMYPAFAAPAIKQALSPNRMVFLYVPNGIVMEDWTPAFQGLGSGLLPETLPRITKVLEPYRSDVLMLTGLTCNPGRALGDGGGDHGRTAPSYLSGVHPRKTSGRDIQAGITMDQIAANHLQGQTRFKSLELGCEQGAQAGNCDTGYSCAYTNNISWTSPTSPNPSEIRPRAIFERLFGTADDEKEPARRQRRRKYDDSLLDMVVVEAQRLKTTLGGNDRNKLDGYLTSVREIEQRIQRVEKENAANPFKVNMEVPADSVPVDFHEHSRLVLDLTALAMQSDATRVITVLMGIELSPRNYPEIGITDGHHGLTHHQGDKAKIEKVTQINEYHIKQFAAFLDKLKSTPDGDGTLLDHSMTVYGSGLADGNAHQHNNLPTILAGRGNGLLKPGRHVRYPDETPLMNMHMSLLDKMNVPVESLGDGTGNLDGLSEL